VSTETCDCSFSDRKLRKLLRKKSILNLFWWLYGIGLILLGMM